MKKKVALSIAALLLISILSFIGANLQTCTVIHKEEKKFCPPRPAMMLLKLPEERKLIKTGNLSFECDNLAETRAIIEKAIEEHDAYISNENYSSYDWMSEQRLEIRVPVKQYDPLVNSIIAGAGELTSRSTDIEDVTDSYADTETRLAVKRELEARYRELLQKATEVKDMLAIEEQIAILRGDIESAEGQIRRMDDQITYSKLTVTYSKTTANQPFNLIKQCRGGLNNGLKNLAWLFIGLINIWPFLLILTAIVFGVRIRRKHKKS